MNTILTGAAVALAAGLLMGAAIKPDLQADDRPEGPQVIVGWGGTRATGPFDDGASFASYHGQTPDYVLGTDWKKSLAPPPEGAPIQTAAVDDPPSEPAAFTRATYDDPDREPATFPSLEGGKDILPPPDEDAAG